MYHPTRGGVRGGRDQFKWDDVKVDKHRENYIGHSIKAPVGRWQKGKDLHWYTKDKNALNADMERAQEEIRRIKEEEERAMQEALGLAPKRSSRPHGNRLDKHEFQELVKRGSTAEDLGAGHAEAAHVQGLGFARAPGNALEESSSSLPSQKEVIQERLTAAVRKPEAKNSEQGSSGDESRCKKRKHEESKREKHEESKREKHEKRHSRDSDDKRKHEKHGKRHSGDSDGRRKHKERRD